MTTRHPVDQRSSAEPLRSGEAASAAPAGDPGRARHDRLGARRRLGRSCDRAELRTTIHVAPNGNDANPGTLSRPKATIQAASSALRNGGVISLRGGTHCVANGGGWLLRGGTKGNRVIVTSHPGELARLVSADGDFCVASNQSYITVKRIDCTGSQGMGSFGGSHVSFLGNRIHDLSAPSSRAS